MENKNKKYYIYIISCENGSLYTGITTDYKRRYLEHMGIKKNGAKFTRSFKPVELSALWETSTRSDATKLESRIKTLERMDKENLIIDNKYFKTYFKNILDMKKYKRKKKICINI